MGRQIRNSENARKNSDGTYDGNGAWKTNQCVPTGTDCYVGDFCCESGDTCPSCTVAPCQCLPVDGEKNKKKSGNRSGNKNRQSSKSDSQCVAKGSACYIGDICCNSGETCPSCNVAPCTC